MAWTVPSETPGATEAKEETMFLAENKLIAMAKKNSIHIKTWIFIFSKESLNNERL